MLRPKPLHDDRYHEGDLVQVRQPSEWVPGKVIRSRAVQDQETNCSAWASEGRCFTDVKHMLASCKKACNASTHAYEYEVGSHMFKKWVAHERLLPHFSGLHLAQKASTTSTDGCLLAGEIWERCGRDAGEMWPRCGRDVGEMRVRCG